MYAGIAAFLLMLVLGVSYKKADLGKKASKSKVTLLKGATTCVAGGLALYSAIKSGGAYPCLISVALFICAVADMVLDHYFTAGMGVFALGHAVYISAFISKGSFKLPSVIVFLLLLIIVYVLYAWAKKHTEKSVKSLVMYSVVLLFMLSQALFSGTLEALGAALFVISDSLIGYRFVAGYSRKNDIACISLYYAAQYLIALSTAIYF